MSKQKGRWLFSCLWWADHSAEELNPAPRLSFDSVPPKQSDTPPFQIKSHFFHSGCQWDIWEEVCLDLIGVEFAVRVWRCNSRRKNNRLNSCSKSKAEPANMPYVPRSGWLNLTSTHWTLLPTHLEKVSQHIHRGTVCIRSPYHGTIVLNLAHAASPSPMLTHILPLSLLYWTHSYFHLPSLGG